MKLYETAIERGNVNAYNNLAYLLDKGAEGVPVDAARAERLYGKAAKLARNVDDRPECDGSREVVKSAKIKRLLTSSRFATMRKRESFHGCSDPAQEPSADLLL